MTSVVPPNNDPGGLPVPKRSKRTHSHATEGDRQAPTNPLRTLQDFQRALSEACAIGFTDYGPYRSSGARPRSTGARLAELLCAPDVATKRHEKSLKQSYLAGWYHASQVQSHVPHRMTEKMATTAVTEPLATAPGAPEPEYILEPEDDPLLTEVRLEFEERAFDLAHAHELAEPAITTEEVAEWLRRDLAARGLGERRPSRARPT